MPPPPWELLVTDKPSILDGLHWKLLGNGLVASEQWELAPGMSCRSVAVSGNAAGVAPSLHGSVPSGTNTPFESTVIPAPSYAPRRVGSCSCSARLPFSWASQPSRPSSGKRSICGLDVVGRKRFQPAPQPAEYPSGTPVGDRKSTRLNSSHSSISYAVFCLKKKKDTKHT